MKTNVLRNWVIRKRSDGCYVLAGEIYNANGRFKDGARVTTSPLLSINFITHIAVTRNTEYYLGVREEYYDDGL